MHRSAPYFARFRDLLGLRFGKKSGPNASAGTAENQSEMDEENESRKELDTLKARGVLKHLHPYDPPDDLEDQISKIVRDAVSSSDAKLDTDSIWDLKFAQNGENDLKFRILAAAEETLGKRIPISYLHEIRSTADVLTFFRIPVKNFTSYTEMARSKNLLPKNLHIFEEPKRFHPSTDGDTAFPGRSIYVTDLRERQFYKGFRAKKEWHHYQEKHFDYNAPPPDCPWDKKKADRHDIMSSLKTPNYPR